MEEGRDGWCWYRVGELHSLGYRLKEESILGEGLAYTPEKIGLGGGWLFFGFALSAAL